MKQKASSRRRRLPVAPALRTVHAASPIFAAMGAHGLGVTNLSSHTRCMRSRRMLCAMWFDMPPCRVQACWMPFRTVPPGRVPPHCVLSLAVPLSVMPAREARCRGACCRVAECRRVVGYRAIVCRAIVCRAIVYRLGSKLLVPTARHELVSLFSLRLVEIIFTMTAWIAFAFVSAVPGGHGVPSGCPGCKARSCDGRRGHSP